MTGYPWTQGDLLLANDLNAAIADATAISGPPGSTAGWPFLPLTGGSPMTGPLTLSGNATLPLHAVPLQQVNTAAAGGPFLPLAGGTVTGATTFSTSITSPAMILSPTVNFGWNGNQIAASKPFSASMLYAGLGNTINFSGGVQGGVNSGQYGLYINHNLGGTATTWSANSITVNLDNVQGGGNALNVQTAVGYNQWLASHAYALNARCNNGGSIYNCTTAGTSAASGGPTGTGTGITDGTAVWSYVGPDFWGNRNAINAAIYINGCPSSGTDANRQYLASENTMTISANQGGTAPASGQSAGFPYSGGDQCWAMAGATNLSGIIGREIDVGIFTGASSAVRTGLQIISYGNLQGAQRDNALAVAGTGASGSNVAWGNAYTIGGGNRVAVSGWAFQYTAPVAGSLSGAGTTYANPVMSGILDLTGMEPTGPAWRANGGTSVLNDGSAAIQSLGISTSGATVSVDAKGYELTGVTVSNGGVGYQATDHVFEPVTGAVLSGAVTSGAFTSFAIVKAGHVLASPPTTLALLGGTGLNAVANATWTQSTGLSLNPTGQHIGFNGTAPVARPTVTGAKGSNAALASLMTALAAYGLVQDSTTA